MRFYHPQSYPSVHPSSSSSSFDLLGANWGEVGIALADTTPFLVLVDVLVLVFSWVGSFESTNGTAKESPVIRIYRGGRTSTIRTIAFEDRIRGGLAAHVQFRFVTDGAYPRCLDILPSYLVSVRIGSYRPFTIHPSFDS